MKTFNAYIAEERRRLLESASHNPVDVDAYHGSGRLFKKFEQKHARLPNDHMGGGVGYFTDNHDVSKTYAKSMARHAKTDTPYIYHTKLKMNTVFDVDHEFHGDKLKHVLPDNPEHHEQFARSAGLLHPGGDKYTTMSDLKAGKIKLSGKQVFFGLSRGGINTASARDHLIKKGYDGIRYNGGENMNMATRHNVYMPYNSDAIKIHKVTQLVTKKKT